MQALLVERCGRVVSDGGFERPLERRGSVFLVIGTAELQDSRIVGVTFVVVDPWDGGLSIVHLCGCW